MVTVADPAAAAPIGLAERFGLEPPWGRAWREVRDAVRGSPYVPRNEWGASSARIFKPSIGWRTWLRRPSHPGLVPIYNFVNRTPRPRDAGYSVKVTTCRDWQGGRFTYDGHLGTDFACPIGTPIVAAAPGVVVRVAIDLAMGGRKVCIDHGDGLFTTSNHLARALVAEGDVVARGQVVGLSGVSGMEFVAFFPWVAPHLHFNVWLDGEVADPFALAHEASLWRVRNDPRPHLPPRGDASSTPPGSAEPPPSPTDWDEAGVAAAIEACRDPQVRGQLRALTGTPRQAAEVLVLSNYRPALFADPPQLYRSRHERAPRLDLPFRADDYRGALLPSSPAAAQPPPRGDG